MTSEYIEQNAEYWDREYYAPNVEGFIFRLKSKLLDEHINFSSRKTFRVLDFGCGEGSAVKYLSDAHHFIPYGVDISTPSIKKCKIKMSKFEDNFKVISPKPTVSDEFFDVKFDLIISIQALYYLSNEDMKLRLETLKKMLNPNSFVFFTMISTRNDYWKDFSHQKISYEGLTTVDMRLDASYVRRSKQSTYLHHINFVKDESDLIEKFSAFKKIKVGFYDRSLYSTSSSAHHYTFFGKI